MTKSSKASTALSLARQEIIEMVPYLSARRLEKGAGNFNQKIWLNANESAGTGEYSITGACINRYPDFQPDNLLQAYSHYSQLAVENLLATRGADEGIELIIRTFCTPYKDNILICPPTYGMYAISAENHGAGIKKVPLVNNELDVASIIETLPEVNVVFLCSPGNPTGNLLPKQQIIDVLTAAKDNTIVVVDEAYIEYSAEHSVIELLNDYPNLIILRTLSKAFALAGLRCGFTLANTEIIELLSKVIAPYPIATPVAELASNALSETGIVTMQKQVQTTQRIRQKVELWLQQQPWCVDVFKTDANFILFRCKNKTALFELLHQHNILIRDQSKQTQLADCLRISIGSEQEMNALMNLVEQEI